MSENNPDYSPSIKYRFVEEPSQLRHSTLSKIESNAATKVGQEIRADSVSKSSASSREHGTILAVDTEQFIIGQKVWVGGVSPGQIAYIGETHFAPGEWAGIVLDEPNGKNDGCVAGKRYFQCESKKGIFSRLTRLTLHPLGDAVDKRAQNYSPDRSRTVSPTPSTQSVLNRKGGRHGFKLGDRVIVSSGFGSRPGTLRFLGVTQFAPGNWCGIELDDSTGKNDGSVEGVRYFECEAKYGIFVPITKVSLSPKKSRLSRAGSRESLTSVGTMNSIATTNTSRLRMQRYSMSIKQPTPSTSKNYFSMQDLLKEKQNHIEQLMIERDMEQEDAQNQALQFQKIILELKSKIESMEKNLDEEKNKTEDLQLSIEEANFCGDELSAQTQVYKERIADLEQRLRAVTTGDENIQRAIDPVKYEVKTEITCTPESKYDSDKKNNQYSFNQNEEPKIENLDTTEALNNFRDLFRKIKDSTSSDATYQDELNRYVQDPNEIRSINLPLNQMGDKFLRDLCESLALSIKEFNLMCIENKNIVTKCINLQNTLENSRREIESIENGKIEIFKNVEELTSNCKNISKANEKLQEENNTFKETIKRLEHENFEITENLQVVTSNCERFVGINKQLQREIESLQKCTKQIEKEKSDASQKLEDFLSNYKTVSEIYSKMETELKTNADNSNLVKGEEFDVSSMFENISFKCRTLSVQNSNLLKNLQTSEDKLNLLVTQKFDVEGENTKLLTKLKSSSELNAKLQQELQVSEENSSQFKKEIIDVSRKLEEMSMNCKILSDVNEKLKDDLKTSAEKLKNMDEEKSEVYKKLEETTLICKNYEGLNKKIQQVNEGQLLIDETTTSELSELNDKLRVELAGCYEKLETIEKQKFDISLNLEEIKIKFESQLEMSHDNYKLLEAEKFDISQKLENVQSTLQTTLEQNENLQEKLKSIQENSNHLEKEKFEISKKFREVYLSLNSSLEQNEKISHELTDLSSKLKVFSEQNLNLQQQLKSLEEKNKDNEARKLELTLNINKVSSAYENLFEQNSKLKEELVEQKNTVKQLEETNFKLYRNLEEVNCKNEILTELSNKLEQKLKTMKNTPKKLDVQNAEAFETLESVTTYCMKLENIKEMLQQDLKLINEKYKQNELEKTEISQKLNDIVTGYINLSEDFGKLEHQLKGNESNQLASEKIDISGNLQEATLQTANLLDLSESLQQKYNIIELKCGQLKAEKLEIFQKFKKLSELNNHLEQELEDFEEKINELEAESYYFSENIIDSTPEGKNPSELNEKMLQKIKENEDECIQLELQKLERYDNFENSNSNNVQQNLEDNEEENKSEDKKNFDLSETMGKVNTSCENLSELNDQLRNYLKNNKDQIDGFKNERSKLIQNIKSISGNLVDLSKLYQKIQFEIKTNRSNNNQLEEINFNVLKELKEFKSSQKNLPDLNNELQKEINTRICDDVSVKSENLIQTSSKNPEESERETEYFNNALSNNDTLRRFSQGISKIEAEINKNQQCDDDAISTTGHSNIEIFLSNDSISKNRLYLIEKCKNQQNVHNEFIIALLYIHQLISSMKIHIENLDKDIQCIPSENRIETDLLSVVEEKSCKLRYDSIDLARRFKCLVIINENYPSLKDSILSILDEPKKNIIEQEACMVIEEVQLLQNIVESYQLLLKANDVEIASSIIAKSSLEPLSTENRSDKSILKNLQSDLMLTKRLFNKLEELNFILKCLRYFQLKISKKNDKVSLEDVSLNVSDTEKKLKVECSELIKILANSIKTLKNSRECSDKSKSTKSELIASIFHIDESIKIINNVMNSKSELLNLLYEKVKSLDENYTDFSSEPLTTDTSKLDAYTKTELKSKQFDEKTAQIDFLHSIIADMQQKNDKLKDKIETLETFSTDSRNCMYKMIHARKPAPRIFCDICDQFDIHETEDCPMQESDGELSFQPDEKVKKENDGTNIMKPLTARKYCENCEAFGDHATEVCCAGLE